jgi:hypothetical protein
MKIGTILVTFFTAINIILWNYNHNIKCDALTYLSDINRPASLIDLQAVQRASSSIRQDTTLQNILDETTMIPPILFPDQGIYLSHTH